MVNPPTIFQGEFGPEKEEEEKKVEVVPAEKKLDPHMPSKYNNYHHSAHITYIYKMHSVLERIVRDHESYQTTDPMNYLGKNADITINFKR